MSVENPRPGAGQISLYKAMLDFEQSNVSYGPPGSYVDIAYGVQNMIAALNAFGLRNQRGGFDYGSNAPQHNERVWATYRERTPIVQDGAAENHELLLEEAKIYFWRATGFAAMRDLPGTRHFRKHQIDPTARRMWRHFEQTYSGVGEERQRRDAYRNRLRKVAKAVLPPEAEAPTEINVFAVLQAKKQAALQSGRRGA